MAEVPNGQSGMMLCTADCLGAPWMCQGDLTFLGDLGHVISDCEHLPTPRQQLRILFSCTPKTWGLGPSSSSRPGGPCPPCLRTLAWAYIPALQ